MSLWNHLLCDHCWDVYQRCVVDHPRAEEQRRVAVRVEDPAPGAYRSPTAAPCCLCGAATQSGIYIRADPKTTKCGGHGLVHGEN
jgi:hypothetical protein